MNVPYLKSNSRVLVGNIYLFLNDFKIKSYLIKLPGIQNPNKEIRNSESSLRRVNFFV